MACLPESMQKLLRCVAPRWALIARVSWPVKFVVPLWCIFVAALLVWGNTKDGAIVQLTITGPPKNAVQNALFRASAERASQPSRAEIEDSPVWPAVAANMSAVAPPIALSNEEQLFCIFNSPSLQCLDSSTVGAVEQALDTSPELKASNAVAITYDVSTGSDQISVEIFRMGLVSSTVLMWENDGEVLAVLIMFLSGVWPYIKIFGVFLMFVLPIDVEWRDNILWILETLGKWSLIDLYVFAIMMAGFNFNLPLGGLASFKIEVNATDGIYIFVTAILLSHVLSHWMAYLHHHHTYPHSKAIVEWHGNKGKVRDDVFPLHRIAKFFGKPQGRPVQAFVTVSIVVSAVLMVVGIVLPSVRFVFSGLAGLALGDMNVSTYSLIGVGECIRRSGGYNGDQVGYAFGDWYMTVVYYLFAIVTPILRLIALGLLWVVPLNTKWKQRARETASLMGTWQTLDVYFVAMVASTIELGKFTYSMVSKDCAPVEAFLGIQCFRTDCYLFQAAWVLLAAIVLSTVATRAVLHTYNQTLRRVVHEEAFSEPAMVSEHLRSMFSIDSFERVDSHPLMRIKFSQKVSFDKRGSMDRAG